VSSFTYFCAGGFSQGEKKTGVYDDTSSYRLTSNLQDLKVGQICNLIWQHSNQLIIVDVSVEHNSAVSLIRQHLPVRGEGMNLATCKVSAYKFLKEGKPFPMPMKSLRVPIKWLLPTSLQKEIIYHS
jgi:type II secretory pathway component HofQ